MSKEPSELIRLQELDYVCSQIRECVARADRSYELFIKICTATIGGSIWLSMQDELRAAQSAWFALLSSVLMVGLAVVSTSMIIGQLRAWQRFRTTLSELRGKTKSGDDRLRRPPKNALKLHDIAMISSIWMIAFGFVAFNPFRLA